MVRKLCLGLQHPPSEYVSKINISNISNISNYINVKIEIEKEDVVILKRRISFDWTLFLTIEWTILNLCLGLKYKKDLVKNILLTNNIDVLAMQETELGFDFDCELLNIPGYTLETEKIPTKKESACTLGTV